MVNCILDNHTMLPIALYHQVQLNGTPSSGAARLEEEEVVMMNLLVQGATLEQIASHIHMSKRTVDNYLRKIYNKLGVRTRTEAIQSFIRSQYIY
ncbi:helix-turn-helix transcriptional regulator [Paenibacillus silvisoli]|uniref:helix-turn-helix transcriptional regulator n=1 Tax=Paenibacillus silvisoli TaxID=3110539 RepID=UPI002B1BDDC4|nr:helix-turn-helix transcriptional regulator [Paenibacillus silvisoli]